MAWPGPGLARDGGTNGPRWRRQRSAGNRGPAPLVFRRAHGKSYRLCGVGHGDADVQCSPAAHAHPSVHPQRLNAQRPPLLLAGCSSCPRLDRAQLLPLSLSLSPPVPPSRVGQGSSHHPHPNRVIVLSLSHHFIYLSDLISYLLPPLLLASFFQLSLSSPSSARGRPMSVAPCAFLLPCKLLLQRKGCAFTHLRSAAQGANEEGRVRDRPTDGDREFCPAAR